MANELPRNALGATRWVTIDAQTMLEAAALISNGESDKVHPDLLLIFCVNNINAQDIVDSEKEVYFVGFDLADIESL